MSVYVYAITETVHPLALGSLTGVGEEPTPLRVVRSGKVAAVVGDAPEHLRPKRRDLKTHQDVLQSLTADGAVLPMRFGLLAPDETSIEAELEARQEDYLERLDKLRDRVEFNVKAVQDEDAALRAVLAASPDLQRLNERTRSGGSHDDRLALGEAVATGLQAYQLQLGGEMAGALRPLSASEVVSEATGEAFANVSFLVDRERVEEFQESADTLARDFGRGVDIRVTGPLPPYSFV
ncbi:GvpL/GvpF family gas vesicle protein [Actinacidiphila glaucinigra]|uniref:GvpL/GvpF family gas vesicle protein n=1 Tax=Actinacidiphila glaucinigra TaxID=235986 RepID=UPI0033AD1C00